MAVIIGFSMINPALGAGQKMFTNPILSGFYPDPSICRVDSNYYLVNSTFSFYPGIPVFHSRDLVHWDLLGHAMVSRRDILHYEYGDWKTGELCYNG